MSSPQLYRRGDNFEACPLLVTMCAFGDQLDAQAAPNPQEPVSGLWITPVLKLYSNSSP